MPSVRHARIMVRFEEVLAEHLGQPLELPEFCTLVGVSDRIFRLCCAEFLGMSPAQNVLLRRLKEVRRALRDADPDIVNVGEVAHRIGFTELGRFAGRYRATFGETPSTTLQRIPGARLAAVHGVDDRGDIANPIYARENHPGKSATWGSSSVRLDVQMGQSCRFSFLVLSNAVFDHQLPALRMICRCRS